MLEASIFDEDYYLTNNLDVLFAIESGNFQNALIHFDLFGAKELRAPNALFFPSYYISQNPDVADAVFNGVFKNFFHHYQLFGETENRAPSVEFDEFDAASYLLSNPDVARAVEEGTFTSALQHFIKFGRSEGRLGNTADSETFTLTTDLDDFLGSSGNDQFIANLSTLNSSDILDGGRGNDSLTLVLDATSFNELTLPEPSNFSNIENISLDLENIIRTPASQTNQSANFSAFSSVKSLTMMEGSTVNNATILLQLGEKQSLHLRNLRDGDKKSATLEDGGVAIAQSANPKSLNLHLNSVGFQKQLFDLEKLVLNFENPELINVNLNVSNTNSVVLKNSGAILSELKISGSGSTDLGKLPNSLSSLDAGSATTDLQFDILENNITVVTGTGNDVIGINGGSAFIFTGEGNDVVDIAGGISNVDTGDGDDTVFLTAGETNITLGKGDDTLVSENGGRDIRIGTLDGGSGNDILKISNSGLFTNIILPSTNNIENFILNNTVHQSLDFAKASFSAVTLKGGSTVDGTTISTGINSGQSLKLQDLIDGDTAAAALGDGGIKIRQPDAARDLNLTLDGVASNASINENIFIDIAGKGVSKVNITGTNSNFIVLENSGRNLTTLVLNATGNLGISSNSINNPTSIASAGSTANLTLITGTGNDTIVAGSGNDSITLTGGANTVTGGNGNDIINLSTGNDTVNSGSGSDTVEAAAGTNSITTESGNDRVTLTGGTNTVNTGSGDNVVIASGGDNNITTGSGGDTVTLTGSGTNTVNTGSGNNVVSASAGNNNIATGSGGDQVNLTGGTNTVNTGAGNDTVSLTAGISHITTGDGDDTITANGGPNNVDIRTLDGGAGFDTLNVTSTGTVTLPTARNIERFFITDTVHQSLDFSFSSTLTGIELDGGTTIDGSTLTITLATGQSLTLDSLTDGDTAAASLADGGIAIASSSLTSLDLILDDVGPSTSTANENIFIDIAGAGITTAKVTIENDSFVVISNSGGALAGLELLGSGTLALGTLPNSLTNINGAAATANLTLTLGAGANTITGGVGNDAITLTGGTNNVNTGAGNDTISTATNLVSGDRINGGDGTDTFEVIHTGLATIPSIANLISIERISIQDTVHQTLNFSALTTITGIELDSGTTIDGATITTTLGDNQSLTLDSITDGDTSAASLADGGITIAQTSSVTSLNLTLDDIGPSASAANTNVYIDIAGTSVATANIISANTSFVNLGNSGGSLNKLVLTGSGTLGIIGTLENSVTTIDGLNSTANLTLTTGTGNDTIVAGSGNDSITLTGGANTVTGGNGNDTINLSTGNDTVNSGSGNDTVEAAAGTNSITTESGNDRITLTGGTNTVVSGNNNDVVIVQGGDNNITTGSGGDTVTLTGSGTNTVNTDSNGDSVSASAGTNTINTGASGDTVTLTGGTNTVNTGINGDIVNASGGNNSITTESGNDQVTLTGGTNVVDTGSNNDTVTLSGGTNVVDTGSNNDTVTLSGGADDVDMGSGDDTVEAAATLSTADTIDGGSGTDTIASTLAMSDALAARLSNFEVFDIKGGGGITHDLSVLTGLTSLKASAALTGNIVITDLAAAADIDISAAIGNNLTINQINSGGGSDTLTFDFRGSSYTTSGIIAANIETVTIGVNQSGTKTISTATFADATRLTINAVSANLTITDLAALNINNLDLSGTTSRTVSITSGADTFANALTYTGGGGIDKLDLEDATLSGAFVYTGGNGNDELVLDNAALLNTFSYNGGNGDDELVLDNAALSNTFIYIGGDGNDELELANATLSSTFSYNGGSGNDILNFNNSNLAGAFSYNGDDGNDTLNLLSTTLVGALTYNGGAGADTLNLEGATLAVGSVLEVGDSQDTLVLNADSVVTTIRTSATNSDNAFSIQDDASTDHTSGFTSGSDRFDYNGSLSNDGVTTIVAATGATLQAAVSADVDATVYVIVDADGNSNLESALNDFADNVDIGRANTLEIRAEDATDIFTFTGLDLAIGSGESVLLAIDLETNESTANNGGTAVYRFTNTNTSTVDTVLATELELIGVFQDTTLGVADFI